MQTWKEAMYSMGYMVLLCKERSQDYKKYLESYEHSVQWEKAHKKLRSEPVHVQGDNSRMQVMIAS